jgi:hypothetical protein
MNTEGGRREGEGREGGGGRVQKLSHKNAIKHKKDQKVDHPLDFLTSPSTPLKRSWPKLQGPPSGFPTMPMDLY